MTTQRGQWPSDDDRSQRVEAPTDPASRPTRTVFERLGWELVGRLPEFERDWFMYAVTRTRWEAGASASALR